MAWHLLYKLTTFVKYKRQQKERKEMKKTEAIIKPELETYGVFNAGKMERRQQQRQQSVFAG